ncbi:McrC family protein [Pseudomonas alliivorans]|uniref:McrC family protein n=1 Tax=Pseudomonas alliivorans TaxID=2810613 RepID=UPI001AE699A0|nr:McrC family protein [Pseudomonas alliivorans]MBP0943652.1 McrC family protein [Pseudomonas alliivorans]MEE4373015.1 McrC family protein [Pseudomonas alliivorans]MEE4881826.1 McrC family protein [Pseudomonas alliivorans]MEE4933248.1 McrC family protein [Pseudomonas alliivorans]MEE4938464.1 McrC family protein [Pseudomonas alliivorans]
MKSITVREYARLTTSPIHSPTLDIAQVSPSAFDWLCELNARFSKAGAALVQIEDRRWLKLDNYVGVLETPCGTRLEILPKHFEDGDCIRQSRALLKRMIQKSLDLPTRKVGAAALQRFDAPLTEWVMSSFLDALDHLIKRGMRFDYQRVEEEQRYLRGQLNTALQVRQPPGRQHYFQIRHDVFLPDRPENRLLKTALDIVCKTTQDPSNWRLSHELRSMLLEVPSSRGTAQDFKQWRRDRLMAHYQPVKPWCELIIQQQTPLAVAGAWQGMSLLFPMEKLFERYVAACLRDSLPGDAKLYTQPNYEFLCTHQGKKTFRLKPDLMIVRGETKWILDTKWKSLDGENVGGNYGLSQTDFYQMLAYGQKYLAGQGELILVYPMRASFKSAFPCFEYSKFLKLYVLLFDLETELSIFELSKLNWE